MKKSFYCSDYVTHSYAIQVTVTIDERELGGIFQKKKPANTQEEIYD